MYYVHLKPIGSLYLNYLILEYIVSKEIKSFADFYEKFTEENPNPIDVAKLNSQLNMNIASLATQNPIAQFYGRRRRGASSCDSYSKWFNQDDNNDGREREGNRVSKHDGTIPTCSSNKYQTIDARTAFLHGKHESAAKSGNILLSFHSGRWHAGIHPEYGHGFEPIAI